MGWKITGTSETMGKGDDGIAVTGINVMFQLDNGDAGTVFVPKSVVMQGQAAVTDRVNAYAGPLESLKGLTG